MCLLQYMNYCSLSLFISEECDYREDAQFGWYSKSTADHCLNYMNIRTVFMSGGLSFA